MLDVYNCRIRLVKVSAPAPGSIVYLDVLSPKAYEREDVSEWLYQALDAAGGWLNMSGQYPLVVQIPDWLELEIVLGTLSR